MPNADQGRNQPPILQLNPADPLVVATRELKPGEEIVIADRVRQILTSKA